MLKTFILLILNLFIITSFVPNYKFVLKHYHNKKFLSKLKLSRNIDYQICDDLKLKHWKNIFKYSNNITYNTNYYKWFVSFNNTLINASENLNFVTSYKYKNNMIFYNKFINDNKSYYNTFKKINYHNNTFLHLNDENIKLSINNNLNYTYHIDIIHPYYSKYRFNIKIYYNNMTNVLSYIELYKHCRDNINLCNNTYINVMNSNNYKNNFLFGRHLTLDIPFKKYFLNNKFKLYNYKYPYLYEDENFKNNIILKLPDNILLDIPKLINLHENLNIKVTWSFKDSIKFNILNINYLNNTFINYIRIFTFI